MSGMVFRARPGRKQVHLNVTSLVDVLFLLLIFFMITGTFKRVGEMELRLPQSTTSTPSTDAPPHDVELVITEDGRLLLGDERIEMPQLKARLQAILAEDAESQVTVKAEEAVQHGQVIRILDIVRESGFQGLGIGTRIDRSGAAAGS